MEFQKFKQKVSSGVLKVKENITPYIQSKPIQTMLKSVKKYTFGFRMGSKFHEALDENSEITIKEATVESLKDTAKSTGSIYASRTLFSVVKMTFLESAIGSALMSSTLAVSFRSLFSLLLATFSKSAVGVLFTSLSATITLSFTSVATTILTLFAGSQIGKMVASTTLGGYLLGLCKTLISIFASVIPVLLASVIMGYLFKLGKKIVHNHKQARECVTQEKTPLLLEATVKIEESTEKIGESQGQST